MMESLFPKIKPKEPQRYAGLLKTICAVKCPSQHESVREPVHSSSIILSEGERKRASTEWGDNLLFLQDKQARMMRESSFIVTSKPHSLWLLKSRLKLQ